MSGPTFQPTASIASELFQNFMHWVGSVWVDQHSVPTMPDELAEFDVASLIPEYRAYMGGGGKLDLERGLTMQQTWLLNQLVSKKPIVCFENSLQPPQASERIVRLVSVEGRVLIDLLGRLSKADDDPMYSTGIYDGGEISHVITLKGQDPATQRFTYWDPWPGRSLLCEENNGAGVAAEPVPRNERLWTISREELEAVLHYVLIPEKSLTDITTAADFEPIFKQIEHHDFFEWFHLERVGATEHGYSRIFSYRPGGPLFRDAVLLNLLANPQSGVTAGRLILHRGFVEDARNGPFAADISKSFLHFIGEDNSELMALAHAIERPSPEGSHPGYEVYAGTRERYEFGVGRNSFTMANRVQDGQPLLELTYAR